MCGGNGATGRSMQAGAMARERWRGVRRRVHVAHVQMAAGFTLVTPT